MSYYHVPVMPREVLEVLACRPGGTYVDCTVGGGGHARLILEQIGPRGRLIGIDRDPAAIAASQESLQEFADQVTLVKANFFGLQGVLSDLGVEEVDGFLFDLGISSHQVDLPQRGFSYMHNAPLDMRMDPSVPRTAAELLNTASEMELRHIISRYGEERWADRIAASIVAARQREPFVTTFQLVDVVKEAIPAAARRRGPHPAKRTFQALRIAVNDELGGIENALRQAVDRLTTGGRIVVISFHSLEDRIVKKTFRELAQSCVCPPEAPVCVCSQEPKVRVITPRPLVPKQEEIEVNPRARSAKLRGAEKLGRK
ncbi:MAG: 16S rRNA (cytosine(1402)-N(4))-methyltransferase RsmH [Limnochordia bacterium]|nr:16S rRNA (cytosine(1402)-N(4))-methyltransferase RsmH [Bacillota bacterium]